jgi:hypothetical protein
VAKTIEINAADKVWKIIGNFRMGWHPPLKLKEPVAAGLPRTLLKRRHDQPCQIPAHLYEI